MDKFFKISERGSTVGREVIGGLTTFLAMAYIIAVNPGILVDAGIPFEAALTATCFTCACAAGKNSCSNATFRSAARLARWVRASFWPTPTSS